MSNFVLLFAILLAYATGYNFIAAKNPKYRLAPGLDVFMSMLLAGILAGGLSLIDSCNAEDPYPEPVVEQEAPPLPATLSPAESETNPVFLLED